MGKPYWLCLLLALIFTASTSPAKDDECSTEKVNHADCYVTIDRSYPVTIPTVQMDHGRTVMVRIKHALPFEDLSLVQVSAQAGPMTDQTAGFVSAVLPNLKDLLVITQATPSLEMKAFLPAPSSDLEDPKKYEEALTKINKQIKDFAEHAATIYDQINEVVGPLPPEILPEGERLDGSKVSRDFPRPWIGSDFPRWRAYMLCEIASQECPTPGPDIRGVLAEGANLVNALAVCPNLPEWWQQPSPHCVSN
jgi:hypothetical protein